MKIDDGFITSNEAFTNLMRRLSYIALRMPKKQCEEIYYVISKMGYLIYFAPECVIEDDYTFDEYE